FRNEIHPPGRFFAHLCGHQHTPVIIDTREGGAPVRRLRQGSSLFGLEHWSGASPKKRLHGYTAGQFIFDHGNGVERLWPRTAVVGRHGGMRLCPDQTFDLDEGGCIATRFEIEPFEQEARLISGELSSGVATAKDAQATPIAELKLLEQPPE